MFLNKPEKFFLVFACEVVTSLPHHCVSQKPCLWKLQCKMNLSRVAKTLFTKLPALLCGFLRRKHRTEQKKTTMMWQKNNHCSTTSLSFLNSDYVATIVCARETRHCLVWWWQTLCKKRKSHSKSSSELASTAAEEEKAKWHLHFAFSMTILCHFCFDRTNVIRFVALFFFL